MSTNRTIIAPLAGKQAREKSSTGTAPLRKKLSEVLEPVSEHGPEDSKDFADALKTLAVRLCSLHLEQRALFACKWNLKLVSDSYDCQFGLEFKHAVKAMEDLEREIDAGIKRQHSLLAALQLRATLLQVSLSDRSDG